MKIKYYFSILLVIFSFNLFGQSNENVAQNPKKSENGFEYFQVYDPLEPLNRRIYYFNYQFDKYIFLPTIRFYEAVTPIFIRKGVNNFFQNTKNVSTMGNSLLQLKIKKAMRTLGRFTMNLAFGLGGVVDSASEFGMPIPYEDFGLTLAHYGVGKGPYLILPILGPSNLRDAFGMGVDALVDYHVYNETYVPSMNNPAVTVLEAINKREHVPFRYYSTGSPFEYEYIRFLYQKYRLLQSDIGTEVL